MSGRPRGTPKIWAKVIRSSKAIINKMMKYEYIPYGRSNPTLKINFYDDVYININLNL